MNTLPNAWIRGLVHRGFVDCPVCQGEGSLAERYDGDLIGVSTCPGCKGARTVEVGCGGEAERDVNHEIAYCRAEGMFVKLAEVPL